MKDLFRRLPCGRMTPSIAFALAFHQTFGPNPYKLGLTVDADTLQPVWDRYYAHMGFTDATAEGDFWADHPGEIGPLNRAVSIAAAFLNGPVRVDVS